MSIKSVNRSGDRVCFVLQAFWPPPGYLGRSSEEARTDMRIRTHKSLPERGLGEIRLE